MEMILPYLKQEYEQRIENVTFLTLKVVCKKYWN